MRVGRGSTWLHLARTIPRSDLGVHLDGFIAVVAHTAVVGASADAPVTGVKADVIAAAHAAAEVALRLVKAGKTNYEVTAAMTRIAEAFGVTPVAGTLSHELKQFVIDGDRVIVLRDDPEAKVEEFTFTPHAAFALDFCFTNGKRAVRCPAQTTARRSDVRRTPRVRRLLYCQCHVHGTLTPRHNRSLNQQCRAAAGEGKTRESGTRTTVFKRLVDNNYNLKSKVSRAFLHEVHSRCAALPFTLRSLAPHLEKGEVGVRAGVLEPTQHGMLQPYPVIEEREGVFVAHVKVTALMLTGGTLKVTGLDVPAYVRSEKTCECRKASGTARSLRH